MRSATLSYLLFFILATGSTAFIMADTQVQTARDGQDAVAYADAITKVPGMHHEESTTHQEELPLPASQEDDEYEEVEETEPAKLRVNKIVIHNSKEVPVVPNEAILSRVSYRLGELFDPTKTSTTIRNLYSLGYFRQVELYVEKVSDELINLHIKVIEKEKLAEVKYIGNKHLSEKEIKKKIDFSKIPAIDEEELAKYAEIIRKLYEEKGYHGAQVKAHLEHEDNKVIAVFTIEPGEQTVVKRVHFKGNKNVSAKTLRNIIFTREVWVLSFMDSSGTYHPDAVEQDRYMIENYYKDHGYLMAKVIDVDVEQDPDTHNFYITFHIEEGPVYRLGEIKIPGNELLTEDQILPFIPLHQGDLYSISKIQKSIETVRGIWGDYGYVYADVEPSVQPDEDTHIVNISLYSELGSKVRLNRINIVGNKKTRDKIIRRQLLLHEGESLTTKKMDASKNRVELLGFFDKRDGVNWKINRISDELCDLDLILKEVRTGSASLQMGTGGVDNDPTNPLQKFNVTAGFSDTNFRGSGVQYDIGGSLSSQEQTGHINVMNPWLFDKPLSGAASLFISRSTYEDLRSVKNLVNEKRIGGTAALGFLLRQPTDTHVQIISGVEHLSYGGDTTPNQIPEANAAMLSPTDAAEFQMILNRRFQHGTLMTVSTLVNKDERNHPVHPSRGYQWSGELKCGGNIDRSFHPLPIPGSFAYVKFQADASWYTPLIGESDLVLCLHAHAGIVHGLGSHNIPYRELFNVGGPSTVRGFLFGQISPMWKTDSIGGQKAFWLNAELLFPIRPDFSIKGAVFYDGGAGWDTPDAHSINPANLRNNNFNYRHAIGVGIRLLNPMPLKIDWGFKLDRNKRLGEPVSELHFTMNTNY